MGQEGRIDPNRDFGFDVDPSKCMLTVAARTVNELFREYIFRLAITFHGGCAAPNPRLPGACPALAGQ
jgi:hypothetical protein